MNQRPYRDFEPGELLKVVEQHIGDSYFRTRIADILNDKVHRDDPVSWHANLIEEAKNDQNPLMIGGELFLGSCYQCHRWLCPPSPTGVCQYKHGSESCIYCRDPEERK